MQCHCSSAYIPQQKPIHYLFIYPRWREDRQHSFTFFLKNLIFYLPKSSFEGLIELPMHVLWIPYLKSIQRNSQLA
jgi:hypothetical protein